MILAMASRVSSPTVIGRDQERHVLEDVLARAATGGGAGVVLVGGEAGIGKTRLLEDAATTALAEGFLPEARTRVDPAQRAAAYDRAARLYLADRPYIYLWHPRLLTGTTAQVEGLRMVPDGLIRLQGLRVRS